MVRAAGTTSAGVGAAWLRARHGNTVIVRALPNSLTWPRLSVHMAGLFTVDGLS